jgi:DNA-binding NtrC family response regulator
MSDAPYRLLIVDDEQEILDVMSSYFSQEGHYEIMTAQHGADAVMLAGFQRPHAVLLDILMPGMDGVEVLRAIRVMDPTIPVVMVTGNADVKIARDTLTIGAFDYVAKPFDCTALNRIVVAAVAAGAAGTWAPFALDAMARRARTLAPDPVTERLGSAPAAIDGIVPPLAAAGAGQ